MRRLRQISALVLGAFVLVACGDGGDGGADAGGCRDAVAEAAEATSLDDANLEPVFDACQGLADLGAAIQQSPELLRQVGADVQGWAQRQCRDSERLRDTALCEAVS